MGPFLTGSQDSIYLLIETSPITDFCAIFGSLLASCRKKMASEGFSNFPRGVKKRITFQKDTAVVEKNSAKTFPR